MGGVFNGGGGGGGAPVDGAVFNFVLNGEVVAGEAIGPAFVHVPAGRVAKLISARHMIQTGTSVTFDVKLNGATATGLGGVVADTAADVVDPADITLAAGDRLSVAVTAADGSPTDLSVGLIIEVT